MVDVDGTSFISTIVRSTNCDITESIEIDIVQRRNRETESRLRHLAAVEDVESAEGIASSARLIIDVHSASLEFSFSVGVVGVQRSPHNNILTFVAVNVGNSDAVPKISTELLASEVG